MTNIKNKNKFLKISSIFLIGVFAVFLAFMPFFMNNNKDKVMADSVEAQTFYFRSSSTVFPVNLCSSSSDSNTLIDNKSAFGFLNLNVVLSSEYGIQFSATIVEGNVVYREVTKLTCNQLVNGSYVLSQFGLSGDNSYPFSTFDSDWHNKPLSFSGSRYVSFVYICSSNFNFNIVQFRVNAGSGFFGSYNGTKVEFIDSNGVTLLMQFPLSNSNYNSFSDMLYYNAKDYYLIDSSDLSDNQFYQQGKDDGLAIGRAEGDAQGYQRGLNEGQQIGEGIGYNDGLRAGSDVSFLNLFGSIVDAPLSALFGYVDKDINSPTYNQRVGGLFNFNLYLGSSTINLKGFFLTLLTITIVVAIIRFAMSR